MYIVRSEITWSGLESPTTDEHARETLKEAFSSAQGVCTHCEKTYTKQSPCHNRGYVVSWRVLPF